MKTPIYLDYSATTPVDPRVAQKMIPCLTENFGNPASRSHSLRLDGREGRRGGARARRGARQLRSAGDRLDVRARPKSINLALKGAAHFYKDKGKHLVTVRTEHKATLDTMRELEREGLRGHVSRRAAGRPRSTSRQFEDGAAAGHDRRLGDGRQQRDRRRPGHRGDRRDLPRARHHLPRRRGAGHRQDPDRPRERSRST